ncbi:lysine-N-methylase [Lachnospiraceae bacterium PM6-15]
MLAAAFSCRMGAMEYYKINYYDQFKCLADKCPETCCAGWQIVIDEKSLDKYKAIGGSLLKGIDLEQECFYQDREGRCAFLRKDNLCEIYKEYDAEYLCDTCKKYPRHIEEFEGERELTISISCPEGIRLLLAQEEPLFFTHTRDEETEFFEEFDTVLYRFLKETRKELIRLIYDTDKTYDEVREQLLAIGEILQYYTDEEDLEEVEIEEVCQKKSVDSIFSGDYLLEVRKGWQLMKAHCEFRDPDFVNMVDKSLRSSEMEETKKMLKFDFRFRQLLAYFIYSYYLGAAYSANPLAIVKMALFNVELIRSLWLVNLRPASSEAVALLEEISMRYSRELEHSWENMNALEDLVVEELYLKG